MKFIDMFCGMGTIRMGFEQAGHECVYSIEWDKHKRRIYEVIFGNKPEGRDITDIRAGQLPASDCWTFGAPCQDFSIAGLRDGLNGDRSSLVREVFRLVRETAEEHRPEWLLYENVKGMLSSNKGLDFLEILFEMASLGYDIEYCLVNSKDNGVPQNRERVYTVGHLRARGERKVFPIAGQGNGVDCQQFTDGTGIAYCLDTGYRKGISPNYADKAKRTQVIIDTKKVENPRFYDDVAQTLQSNDYKEPLKVMSGDCFQRSQSGVRNIGSRYGTLRGQASRTDFGVCDQSMRIRRLTPRECMRLQGVPDYITDKLIAAGISDTQLYRAAGDACTVNVVYEIAKAMEATPCNQSSPPQSN